MRGALVGGTRGGGGGTYFQSGAEAEAQFCVLVLLFRLEVPKRLSALSFYDA